MRSQPTKKARIILLFFLFPLLTFANGHESGFEDSMADVVSWIAIIVAPIAGIGVFLFVHVLPEKIAEKRNHPQAEAIKILCILSLFFGGLLWPLAWLWAYSKPVFYKMAYGTDQGDYHEPTLKELKDEKKAEEAHKENTDLDTN
ncbi:DUF3302 domain-containing protein [Formosa sp. PL04]|uniref:DUF3302 domain-containing protein n=1 Tax=Formosa sp. PL04 TaxID=3081755 RepID=UPI0029812D41|nr:DUF3302 domain-containing protein [Formosa sp. PL04]MDW5290379.1 DUF3302 domain-containing protein [Formosa sp. PL04]